MTQIVIEIKDCSACPFFDHTRVYTGDSWEDVWNWQCQKADRKIAGGVEWTDKIPVPDWCPIKVLQPITPGNG